MCHVPVPPCSTLRGHCPCSTTSLSSSYGPNLLWALERVSLGQEESATRGHEPTGQQRGAQGECPDRMWGRGRRLAGWRTQQRPHTRTPSLCSDLASPVEGSGSCSATRSETSRSCASGEDGPLSWSLKVNQASVTRDLGPLAVVDAFSVCGSRGHVHDTHDRAPRV